jgi:very-short-patch-repair endonuclease
MRRCKHCQTPFKSKKAGTPYANFCSPACVTAHKVKVATVQSSRLEQRLGELLTEAGLTYTVQKPFGPFVADLAFPQVRLLVEVDGEAFHTTRSGEARDDRKDQAAHAAGWRILHLPQFMIEHHPQEAVRAVLDAYLQR